MTHLIILKLQQYYKGVNTMKGNNKEINHLTKESLKLALIQLLEENSIDQISITTLTKHAGVSRMAYYRNYASIIDLYHDVYNDYFHQFFESNIHFLFNQNFFNFWEGLFNFLFEHQAVAKILLSSKESHHFLSYLNNTFCDSLEDTTSRYIIRGVLGSIFNVMTEWIKNEFDLAPRDIAQLCTVLIQDANQYTNANVAIANYWHYNND